MRILLLTSILGIAVMHHEAILVEANRLLSGAESAEVAAALEVRCGGAEGLERRHCEADLRDAFERGTSDAGAIVRLHCTRFENRWTPAQDDSPICATLRES